MSARTFVRRAKETDIISIVVEMKALAEHTDSMELYTGGSDAYDFVRNLIENHLVFVTERYGKLTGFIGGAVGPHYMNPKIRVLTESIWWVLDKNRQSFSAKLLLDEFVAWGDDYVDWIIFSIDKNCRVNDRAFLKRGFDLQEKVFVRRLK